MCMKLLEDHEREGIELFLEFLQKLLDLTVKETSLRLRGATVRASNSCSIESRVRVGTISFFLSNS